MRDVAKIIFAELVVITIGVASIAVFYIFVIPHYSTYIPLVLGLILIATASGYVARKLPVQNRMVRWITVAIISAAATIITLNLALFWIVNVRGS
jgi:hypothetical protein